jgi:hypothetical protein
MSGLAFAPAKTAGASLRRGQRKGEGDGKKFLRFFPCNPLISLDSDERIQGNPNKSNLHSRRVLRQISHRPRKSKWTGPRPALRPLPRLKYDFIELNRPQAQSTRKSARQPSAAIALSVDTSSFGSARLNIPGAP